MILHHGNDVQLSSVQVYLLEYSSPGQRCLDRKRSWTFSIYRSSSASVKRLLQEPTGTEFQRVVPQEFGLLAQLSCRG